MIRYVIDPGHGGDTIGACYRGRKEQDDCLRLAKAVRDILVTQKDVETLLTREDDVDVDLLERCDFANDANAYYFLSLHRNAFVPEGATGVEAWVYSKTETGGVTYNKAQLIVDRLCEVTGYVNRGVKKGAPEYRDYAVNRYSEMHSCLLEVGFIDNTKDNVLFDTMFADIALSIATSLLEIAGIAYVPPVIKGDADGDGKVTAADARLILRAAVGLEDVAIERGDLDGDGRITSADAREALKFATGQEG